MARHYRTLALLSVLVVPGLSGCSVIGFTAGAIQDSNDAVTRVDTVLQEGSGPFENRVCFVTSSGDTCRGELLEVTRTATVEYREWYARWQSSQPGGRFAPSLGDPISLSLTAKAVARGNFVGFSEQAVVIHTSSLYSARDLEIPFAEIDTAIDSKRNRTAGADFQRDAKDGVLPTRTAIPTMTVLVVAMNGRDSTFAMKDVRWVELTYIERTATGKITGLLGGLLADAIIVGAIVFIGSGWKPM